MTEEKDLKAVEGDTTEGEDQPEEKTAVSEEETETISKSELEQLRKASDERDNYKKAVIRLNKQKGRSLPGSEPVKEPIDEFEERHEEYVTKQDLEKRDEKEIVMKACENPEIDENWEEILLFYTTPRDKSYEGKMTSIQKAYKLWSLDKKLSETPRDKGKQVTKELANEKGLSLGKEKQPENPKKPLFEKSVKMENWYNKPEK